MQNITDKEFEREVEALKSHRRISANRPILDPDLPDMAAIRGGGQEILGAAGSPSPPFIRGPMNVSNSSSSSPSRRVGVDLTDEGPASNNEPQLTRGAGRQAFTARRRNQASALEAANAPPIQSNSRASGSRPRSPNTSDSTSPLGRPSDPSHLFWVPASVHPELSPSHFRDFLQEHASRAARERDLPNQQPSSPGSASGAPNSESTSPMSFMPRTSMARRGSTLRRQYRPDHDTDDEDHTAAPRRPSPSLRPRDGEPALSISDLQKLEALAEEATKSRDETELRSVLRRTMSLGAGTSTMDTVDAVPPVGDDADAPIIVPPPGQILRRAARTKIRKSSISASPETADRINRLSSSRRRAATDQDPSRGSGDTSHLFEGDRFGTPNLAAVAMTLMQRSPSDNSELSSGDDESLAGGSQARPVSEGATDSIVDAYSRDSIISDTSQTTDITSLGESETVDAYQSKLSLSIPSPPETPTPVPTTSSQRGGGYFDLTSRGPDNESVTSPTSETRRGALSESPLQSPEHEYPSNTASTTTPAATTGTPPESAWPIPVSYVPPVPSFEKSRAQSSTPQQLALQQQQNQQQHQQQHHQQQQQQQQHQQPLKPTSANVSAPVQQKSKPSVAPVPSSAPLTPNKSRDREKRSGGFASWFGIGKDEEDARSSKEDKKREKHHRKEREKEDESAAGSHSPSSGVAQARTEHNKEKDKDVGSFLGALFGKKKGNDDSKEATYHRNQDNITAGSLLDQRAMANGGRLVNGHARYPIHVERAVYRLSHIKLANPRRPLYEQVLISNLMFWYLSIVNRSQQQAQSQQKQQPAQLQSSSGSGGKSASTSSSPSAAGLKSEGGGTSPGTHSGTSAVIDVAVQDRATGHSTSANSSTDSTNAMGSEASSGGLVSVIKQAAPIKSKKGGLVKPNRAPVGRSAEQPILPAGYGAQHRQINNDLALAQQQQQQQHQQQQQFSMPSSISVGQVIDPRALPYTYTQQSSGTGYHASSYEDNTSSSSQQRRSGGGSVSNTSPRTSPNFAPQRITNRSLSSGGSSPNASDSNLASNSGAWLGGGASSSHSSSMGRSLSRGSEGDYDRQSNGFASERELETAFNGRGPNAANRPAPHDSDLLRDGQGFPSDTDRRKASRSEVDPPQQSSANTGKRLGYRVGSVGDLRSGGSFPMSGSRGMSYSSSSPSLANQRDGSDGGSLSHRSVSGPVRNPSSHQQDPQSFYNSATIDASRLPQSRRS